MSALHLTCDNYGMLAKDGDQALKKKWETSRHFSKTFFFSISDWSRCRVSESEIKSFRFSLFLVFLDIDIESLKIEINCNGKLCTYIYHKKNAIHRIVSILKTNRLISNAKEWKKIVQGLVFSLSLDETDKTKHISSSFVRNSHGQWVSYSLIRPFKFRNFSVHERMKISSNYPVLNDRFKRLPIIANSSDRKISAHALTWSVYLQKLSLICRL